MTLARRRLLHRRVAAALGARGQRELHAAVIAHHLALGGDEAAAAELYRVAGDRARALYANAEALGHYRAALALGYPDPAVLHEAVGDLETLAGDYGARARELPDGGGARRPGARARGRAPHRRPAPAPRRVGAGRGVARAPRSTASTARAAARATADRSLAAHRRGLPDEAARLAAEALALAEQAGDPRARAQAHNVLGILAASRGDAAGAVRHLEAEPRARARDAATTRRRRPR